MKTKRSICFLVSTLLSAVSFVAQETVKHNKIPLEFSKVVIEPEKPVSVEFLARDTLKVTPDIITETNNSRKRKGMKNRFTIYTIEAENCVSLECSVGNSTIQLKRLDNLIMYKRYGQIDIVSISGGKEIRLADIKAISITVDTY